LLNARPVLVTRELDEVQLIRCSLSTLLILFLSPMCTLYNVHVYTIMQYYILHKYLCIDLHTDRQYNILLLMMSSCVVITIKFNSIQTFISKVNETRFT